MERLVIVRVRAIIIACVELESPHAMRRPCCVNLRCEEEVVHAALGGPQIRASSRLVAHPIGRERSRWRLRTLCVQYTVVCRVMP
jgi:hypothetical protein